MWEMKNLEYYFLFLTEIIQANLYFSGYILSRSLLCPFVGYTHIFPYIHYAVFSARLLTAYRLELSPADASIEFVIGFGKFLMDGMLEQFFIICLSDIDFAAGRKVFETNCFCRKIS